MNRGIALLFACLFPIIGLGQNENPKAPVRIAVINVSAFVNHQTGIKRLTLAENSMNSTDCSAMHSFSEVLRQIREKDALIADLKRKNQTNDRHIAELKNLERSAQGYWDENGNCKKQTRDSVVEPIWNQVNEKLKEFIELKKIDLVVEPWRVFEGSIKENKQFEDITNEFIQYCNDAFEKRRSISGRKIWPENQSSSSMTRKIKGKY